MSKSTILLVNLRTDEERDENKMNAAIRRGLLTPPSAPNKSYQYHSSKWVVRFDLIKSIIGNGVIAHHHRNAESANLAASPTSTGKEEFVKGFIRELKREWLKCFLQGNIKAWPKGIEMCINNYHGRTRRKS